MGGSRKTGVWPAHEGGHASDEVCCQHTLLATPALIVSEFACPGFPAVSEPETAPFPEVVLARKGAYIRRDCAGAVYIDRTVAAFFEANRPYVIEHPQRRADLTTVISLVQPAAVCDALGVADGTGRCFARSAVRASPGLHLLHRHLLSSLRAGPDRALAAEEAAVGLVTNAVAMNHELAPDLAMRQDQGGGRHEVDVVVAIAEYLNASFRSPVTLSDLAAHTGYSVFHICRLFQARMKTSVHRYLTTLRLQAALEALSDSEVPIVDLAMNLGFSSHGHFTGAFTRWAGASPSQVRRATRSRVGR